MNLEQWSNVERYFTDLLVQPDEALAVALQASDAAGLPPINVSPTEGKFLHLLTRLSGARTVLEIGTLAGYSTIWLARALPSDGRLVTLELEAERAELARTNVERAGLANVVEIRVGPADDSLQQLVAEDHPPFDLIFIDADKPSNPSYLEWSLKLSQSGTVIVGDNVVRHGEVIDGTSSDPSVQGIRRFNEMLAHDPRLSSTALQTVGSKGYDGFTVTVVS